MKPTLRRSLVHGFLLVLVALVAAPSTPALAAPLQLMLPGKSIKATPAVQCVTEILIERLSECSGIDIVTGHRASHANGASQAAALDMDPEARWRLLRSWVAIDAMLSVEGISDAPGGAEGAEGEKAKDPANLPANIEVRIFRGGGTTSIKANVGETGGGMPRAISDLAVRVGRELKLGEADLKILGEIRIENPVMFRVYYSTRTNGNTWPQNGFINAFFAVQGLADQKPHWSGDAATVRMVAGYTNSAMHGRAADKLAQTHTMAAAPLLRLLGTPHEDEALPLLQLERGQMSAKLLDNIESMLLQIATPVTTGKTLPGAPEAEAGGAAAPAGKGGAAAPGVTAPAAGDLDDLDDVKAGTAKPADKTGLHDAMEAPTELSARTGRTDFTPAQRLGALRMLGAMATPRALPLLQKAARLADPEIRRAAAEGLVHFKDELGLDTLQRLDADADPTVAFAAGISLRDRKHPSPAFAAHATAMLASPEPWRTRAAVALASNPALEDRAVIAKLAADAAPSVRAALRKAQATSAVPRPLAELATDPDGEVIANAIRRIPPASIAPGGEPYLALVRFANDPDDVVVKAARNALAPHRPKEPVARARYDLAIEAPYLRHKAVALLAASKDPAARTALLGAVANDDPHTRIAALQAIAALDPAMARERLFAALADAHKLVRFHAAVLLAPIADASQAGGLRGVLAVQKDHATALYIADALARAESKPAPLPGQPANLVTGPDTIPWVWGPVGGRADSPYRANFMPSHGNHVRDDAITDIHKQGHALGRAYFYNIAAPSEPGLSLIDSSAQDNCWLYMDDQLNTDRLPFIDGIDFANSSLSPESLWPEGWRFFCEEAGIDSARVAGDKKKLNPYETRAWEVWSLRLCVEGRNRVYDYAKLKFGKLHPGFQVCESLGGFNGPGEIISQWKFDIGFCGYPGYAPESRRAMFNLIRRAKTLWPDRPVFWLGDGLEVKDLAIVKYDFKTPSTPMTGRSYRSYTDALSAWMAGADPGWANLWCLRAVNWGEPSYSGASISPEDTFGEAPKVREAIEMAFENVEPVIRQKEALAKASSKSPSLVPGDKEAQMDGLIESMVKSDGPDPMAQRIAKEKEQMLIGFKIYGKHLLDLARLFASLPRNNLRSDALVVLPEPAYQSERPNPAEPESGSPITELLNTYDVALNVNDASYLDLNRYRFIAVKDPEALSDAAIAAVTRWLKETPGVLYVHLDLTADNTRQASTPESLDGRLKNDWPWEGDVAVLPAPKAAPEPAASEEVGESTDADAAKAKAAKKLTTAAGAAIDAPDAALARTFKPAGPAARVLCSMGGSPALVAWQRPEFKGAVFFDGVEGGGAGYRNAVRDALAELKAKANVGVALPGPAKHETLAADAWSADVTLGAGDRVVAKGVDLLTGELDPVVGPDRGAAMVFRDFKGKYAAAYNGVAVLCDRPIRKVDKVEGGLRIECDGLIQAASESGKVVVAPAEGAALPAVPAEKYVRWLLLESSEGVATQTAGDGANAKQNVVSYIRCGRALTLKAK